MPFLKWAVFVISLYWHFQFKFRFSRLLLNFLHLLYFLSPVLKISAPNNINVIRFCFWKLSLEPASPALQMIFQSSQYQLFNSFICKPLEMDSFVCNWILTGSVSRRDGPVLCLWSMHAATHSETNWCNLLPTGRVAEYVLNRDLIHSVLSI